MRFERPVDLAAMLLVRFFSRTSNASAMTVSARAISRRFSQVGNETKSSAACWLTRKRNATHRFDAPATLRCADLYLSSKSEPSSRKPMIDINGMTDVILTVSRYDKATAFVRACSREDVDKVDALLRKMDAHIVTPSSEGHWAPDTIMSCSQTRTASASR